MKVVQISLLVFASVMLNANTYADRVGDFALLDNTGKFYQLSYYGDQQTVVILSYAAGSKAAEAAALELQALSQASGTELWLLNTNPADSRETVSAAAVEANIKLPILMDQTLLVAQQLGLKSVGEVVVIDAQTMSKTYQGGIAGVSAVLNAKNSAESVASTAVEGAPIAFVQADNVSYTNDIVPILKDNCVQCHYEGGIGPWAMNSHVMVQGFSQMMKEVVMTKRMPPGQIDTHVTKPLREVAGLTAEEQQKLISWIDAGAPQDGEVDLLAEVKISTPKFTFGEPDLIFKVPPQSIPATGIIDYRYVPVELSLDRDVWVEAMEFVPGDAEVLHHVIAYVSSPADKTVRGRETGAAQGESVGGFAPGRPGEIFRDNSGRLIRKGSNLLLQMHYTTSGREAVDETEIGVFLHDNTPKYVMAGGVAGQRRFFVPPHTKEHKLEGVQEIERDAFLYSMMPHMHYRGKYMNYSVEYPDGKTEMLLSVPRYDFNWQFNYELKEPLFLPAGSRLIARGAMDNSDRNPGNPDPSKPVHFGLQTKHEMFFGFTTLRYVGDSPDALVAGKTTNSSSPSGR